jgi:hypothetical protein
MSLIPKHKKKRTTLKDLPALKALPTYSSEKEILPANEKDIRNRQFTSTGWEHNYPEEQGLGFTQQPHMAEGCPCGESEITHSTDNNPWDYIDSPIVSDFPETKTIVNSFDLMEDEVDVKFSDIISADVESQIKKLYDTHPEIKSTIDSSAWIQTYTGKKLYPQNPLSDSICIEDIAHALSNQCRFTGHVSEFYSVAQHSVLVSYFCDSEDALYGLLHDSAEAYCTDLPSPIKRLPEFANYRKMEKLVQGAICRKFHLNEVEPTSVKRADLMMLGIEAKSLMSPLHPEWNLAENLPPLTIAPLSPKEAENLFLNRFNQLIGDINKV